MQEELGADVVIHGVNGIGHESGNEAMVEGRALPWLQDLPDADVWTTWGIEYRDVVVLDANNNVVGVYNLSDNDLAVPENFAELKDLMR